MRIEEAEASSILPQVIRLRAMSLGRSISLSPDMLAWTDSFDLRACHWCVYNDAELVAAARMSIHSSLEGMADGPLYEPLVKGLRYPVAVMSHCVVNRHYLGLHLDKALDAARIERARQVRCSALLTVAENRDRAKSLEALGFRAAAGLPVAWRRQSRPALVLHLPTDLRTFSSARARRPSRS